MKNEKEKVKHLFHTYLFKTVYIHFLLYVTNWHINPYLLNCNSHVLSTTYHVRIFCLFILVEGSLSSHNYVLKNAQMRVVFCVKNHFKKV